jgi:hypothetical protein
MIGRITVIKTLILPHVGFVSTILRPPGHWAEKLNNACENFVLGAEKVAKTKLYLTPKMGGLGLINMEDFIKALKCSWFKKAILGTNDPENGNGKFLESVFGRYYKTRVWGGTSKYIGGRTILY